MSELIQSEILIIQIEKCLVELNDQKSFAEESSLDESSLSIYDQFTSYFESLKSIVKKYKFSQNQFDLFIEDITNALNNMPTIYDSRNNDRDIFKMQFIIS